MYTLYKLNNEKNEESCIGYDFLVLGARYYGKKRDIYECIYISDRKIEDISTMDASTLYKEIGDNIYQLVTVSDSVEKCIEIATK